MTIQAARGLPRPRMFSDAELAHPPAPRQEAAYRCTAGHGFAVVFAARIVPPGSWDCRCGAGAMLAGTAPAAGAADRDEESNEARHHRFMHERRSMAQLEELLAERMAEVTGLRAAVVS